MDTVPAELVAPLREALLALADDKLVRGHRSSDWTGLGPMLEEDIAFSSLAQDNIAHAQALYELVGELTGASADELAFGRDPEAYRCATIVELPDDFDYATAIARQLFCTHADELRLRRLSRSAWAPLAALAKRLAAEEHVQVEHADGWTRRLGRGPAESVARLQAALDRLAPHAAMVHEPTDGQDAIEAAGLFPRAGDPFDDWADALADVVNDTALRLDLERPDAAARGGRRGAHSEHLAPLLDEMCEVYRVEPGAAW